jgi:hypothetical protein
MSLRARLEGTLLFENTVNRNRSTPQKRQRKHYKFSIVGQVVLFAIYQTRFARNWLLLTVKPDGAKLAGGCSIIGIVAFNENVQIII